ncbi:hypothetical protein EAF00_005988 [Botryotinia globosa]|nr:hypothetical protein EAF00_005988 [Botryotinia globosa]
MRATLSSILLAQRSALTRIETIKATNRDPDACYLPTHEDPEFRAELSEGVGFDLDIYSSSKEVISLIQKWPFDDATKGMIPGERLPNLKAKKKDGTAGDETETDEEMQERLMPKTTPMSKSGRRSKITPKSTSGGKSFATPQSAAGGKSFATPQSTSGGKSFATPQSTSGGKSFATPQSAAGGKPFPTPQSTPVQKPKPKQKLKFISRDPRVRGNSTPKPPES